MDHTYCLRVEISPPVNSISGNGSLLPEANGNDSTTPASNGGKKVTTYSKEDINLFRRPHSKKLHNTRAKSVNKNSAGESSSGLDCPNSETADVECTIFPNLPQIVRVKIEPADSSVRDQITQTEVSSISRNPLKSFSTMTDQQIENHTGFHPNTIRMIWSLLTDHHPKAFVVESALTTEDQLLLVLYKYRHNPETSMLADEFAISGDAVSLLVKTITCQLYELLTAIDFWKFSRAFSVLTGASKAIVDVVEIAISPVVLNETEQRRKALVSAAECGCFNFCSDLYDGDMTDTQLMVECGFADFLRPGHRLLTGKSINIDESSFGKTILLNVVPTSSDWEIRRKRTIIERLLSMVKSNKILLESIDSQLASQVFYNCVMLCNFKPNTSTASSVPQED